MKKAILFILLLSLGACGYIDPSLTDQTVVYTDAPVRKSSLQVSIHPKNKQYRPLTAYFQPFLIQQENSDHRHLADAFAQIFHNVWTEERVFPVQEFQPGTPYRGLRSALEHARRRGADLLIFGMVPYFYAGHTLDDTAITIQMNIYSVQDGTLLWTMMQSGRIESRMPDDYFYVRHEFRMNDSPFNMIIRDIAKDMSIPLKSWLPSPDTTYSFANSSADMRASLTAEAPITVTESVASPDAKSSMNKMDLGNDKEDKEDKEETKRPEVNGVNLNIEFDFDKAVIKKASYPTLDAFGEAMNSPELKGRRIIIAGHTDAKGSAEYNLKLSKQRAESVKQYLIKNWNLDSSQVDVVGYGQSRPIATGKDKDAMQKNRRVEIRLAE